MRYFIGIDGGGTKTHLKAISAERRLLGEAFGGASNLAATPEKDVENNLTVLLQNFLQQAELSPAECGGLCLGTAGAGSKSVRERLERILRTIAPTDKILVTDDALPALYGGTLSGYGVILISGTGSICLARSEKKTARTGGWGHILGDEGSGYAISISMLNAVMRAFDGRGPETRLTPLVLRHLNLPSPELIIDSVYHTGKGKSDLASLAFLCDIAYDNGDSIAKKIIEHAAEALSAMALAAEARADFQCGNKAIPCVYAGGTLCGSAPLRTELEGCLFRSGTRLRLCECREDAAFGCALIASSI